MPVCSAWKSSKGVHSATHFVDKTDETKGNWGSLYSGRFFRTSRVHTHLAVAPVSYATYCLAQRHSIKGWQNAWMYISLSLSLLWAMVQKIFLWTRQRPLMINASRAKTFEHHVHMHEQYHLFSYMHTNKLTERDRERSVRETERRISPSNFSSLHKMKNNNYKIRWLSRHGLCIEKRGRRAPTVSQFFLSLSFALEFHFYYSILFFCTS